MNKTAVEGVRVQKVELQYSVLRLPPVQHSRWLGFYDFLLETILKTERPT